MFSVLLHKKKRVDIVKVRLGDKYTVFYSTRKKGLRLLKLIVTILGGHVLWWGFCYITLIMKAGSTYQVIL